jgi:16S rRNA (uracil1498-N3)-methyltransferase
VVASALVIAIEKERSILKVRESTLIAPSPFLRKLAMPLMRVAKLEWIIEKVTELGADAIALFAARRSSQERASSHLMARWRMITIAALKQSGRAYLPSLSLFPHLEGLLSAVAPSERLFFGDLRSHATPISAMQSQNLPGPLWFITGPEGGFSPEELSLLDRRGKGVRIHPHTLRAETAPLVALCRISPDV